MNSVFLSIGGNALQTLDPAAALQAQEQQRAGSSMDQAVAFLKSGTQRLAICHGNGPQVGRLLLQQEQAFSDDTQFSTLDGLVADTQGRIGYYLQQAFNNIARREGVTQRAVSCVTEVEVDANDPAFKNPTKPIGAFYEEAEALSLSRRYGWQVREDAGRGWRRVVPSPRPIRITEAAAATCLLDQGFVPIIAGGGGIPVVRQADGEYAGVEAVIDKDRSSALAANELKMDVLLFLCPVSHVYRDFGTPQEAAITDIKKAQMQRLLEKGQFPRGSMAEKVEAAVDFVAGGGALAIITDIPNAINALAGKTGTRIQP